MNLRSMRLKIAVFALIAAVLAGCTTPTAQPSLEPTLDMRPTFSLIQTQAVETAVSEMTLSAPSATPVVLTETPALPTAAPTDEPTAAPTATLAAPTALPTIVPTSVPTNTFVPRTSTPAISATPANFGCTLTDQSPPFGYDLPPGGDFDGRWTIKNTGAQTWAVNEIDIEYVSGAKFQTDTDGFDLPVAVAKDATYGVVVDMLAPREAGRYSATWQVRRGSQVLCTLPITIDVVP